MLVTKKINVFSFFYSARQGMSPTSYPPLYTASEERVYNKKTSVKSSFPPYLVKCVVVNQSLAEVL